MLFRLQNYSTNPGAADSGISMFGLHTTGAFKEALTTILECCILALLLTSTTSKFDTTAD